MCWKCEKTAASGNATLIWSCTVGKVTRKVAPTHSSLIVTNQSSACATCLAFRQWARRVWTLTEVTGMSRVRVLRMIHLREMRGNEKHSVQSVLLLRINFKLLCNNFFCAIRLPECYWTIALSDTFMALRHHNGDAKGDARMPRSVTLRYFVYVYSVLCTHWSVI